MDLRVDYSNSLFDSEYFENRLCYGVGEVLNSQNFSATSPNDWEVVYLMVGHLKITGYSETEPVSFTVNYTDPPGHNFPATLCSVVPTQRVQNTDFTPICEDIGTSTKITISIDLAEGDSVTNMKGYLAFLEVDRRPGRTFNPAVSEGMNTGDANQRLVGFSTGAWDGKLR